MEKGESFNLDLNGETMEVSKDHVLINITARQGFTIEMQGNLFVILDTSLTQELIDEGYAREFVSKVQQMRKNQKLEVTDNINIYFNSGQEIADAVKIHKKYIAQETLALDIERVEDDNLEKQNLNDHDTGIKIVRIKK